MFLPHIPMTLVHCPIRKCELTIAMKKWISELADVNANVRLFRRISSWIWNTSDIKILISKSECHFALTWDGIFFKFSLIFLSIRPYLGALSMHHSIPQFSFISFTRGPLKETLSMRNSHFPLTLIDCAIIEFLHSTSMLKIVHKSTLIPPWFIFILS